MNQEQQLLMAYANCHRGDLDGLLKGFFKFLHDYTDLYVVDENPTRMGFRPGQAESKILAAFKSFPYKSTGNTVKASNSTSLHAKKDEQNKPSAASAVNKSKESATTKANQPIAAKTTKEKVATDETKRTIDEAAKKNDDIGVNETIVEVQTSPQKQDKKQKEVQIPVGNGGTGPGYTWTQTLSEVTVYIPVPRGTRGKQIKCDFKADSIRLRHESVNQTILEGRFPPGETIDVSESSWCLNDDNCILVMLTKKRETWWDSVVEGHPKIDTTKVDSTKRVADYDPETQAAIRKLIVEQNLQFT